MARLIDAEALLKEFCKKQKEFAPWDYDPIEIIDSAPTVEIISEEKNSAIWQFAEENDISKWIIREIIKIVQAE